MIQGCFAHTMNPEQRRIGSAVSLIQQLQEHHHVLVDLSLKLRRLPHPSKQDQGMPAKKSASKPAKRSLIEGTPDVEPTAKERKTNVKAKGSMDSRPPPRGLPAVWALVSTSVPKVHCLSH